MDTAKLVLMEKKEIGATFTKRFFDLQKIGQLVEKRRGDRTASLQKLVQPLMSHITRGDISKCEPAAFSRFLEEGCRIARVAVSGDDDGRHGGSVPPGVMDCCVWLCSLSAAGSASLGARMETAGTWIHANLVWADAAAMENSQGFLESLVLAVAPLGLPEVEISPRARTEFVLYESRRLSSRKATSEAALTWAKQLCAELIAAPVVAGDSVGNLKEAAKILGVALPTVPKAGIEPDPKPRGFTPSIFAILRQVAVEGLQTEWEACLTELLGVPDEVLAKPTARRVRQLTPETPHIAAAEAMVEAAWDIWGTYWRGGDKQQLAAARRFAEFGYAVQKTKGLDSRQRTESLHVILNLQLPELIRIAALEPIREEAGPLMRAEGCSCIVQAVLAGIVQAVAGECHAAERSNDMEDRDTLLTLHCEQLRQMHKEYEKLSRDRNTGETEAWIYLAPLLTAVSGGGDDHRSKMDQNLVRLVNRGNHSDVLKDIGTQLEQFRSDLERKLTRHHLSGEHLMQPTGKIINPQARGVLYIRA